MTNKGMRESQMEAAPAQYPAKAGTVLLVGCGQMGAAMLRGWIAREAAARFVVVEPAAVPEFWSVARDPTAVAVERHSAASELSPNLKPDAVVFAVKPQVMDEVLQPYRRWVQPETVFISIAAGKTIEGIARHLGDDAAIIRCMPNTPAAIGCAITVACPNNRVTAAQRELCGALLGAIGESTWVEDEALMDAVTAVSGSGPAYVFLLIEALAAAGERAGLEPELALHLARSTIAGAGRLAQLSPETPARLRQNVTSPGGTTQAALEILMGPKGLSDLLDRAVAAATARSRELAN